MTPMTATASQSTSTFLDRLNPQQRAVVTAPDGHALVLAGAGSGKTTTLINRVSWLIDQGIDPAQILLLTFTRQAADEMQRRAATLLGQPQLILPGGTFHSWANSLLKRYGTAIGLSPRFSLLDEDDAQDLIGQLRAQYPTNANAKLPTKQTISRLLSKSINLGVPLGDILEQEEDPLRIHLSTLRAIARDYTGLKRAQHLVDYDDLLVLTRELLQTNPSIREKLQATFRYVLVDEYQDTNGLQVDIIAALAGPQTSLMVVGDDSQSIYAFRGADVTQIRTFCARFGGTQYLLEHNYRSTPDILHLANHVQQQSTEALHKTLISEQPAGVKPTHLACTSPANQAVLIVDQIQRWMADGMDPNDIAVLFRASHHVHDLELLLTRHRIPFEKRGGVTIQDLAHVKDLVSYLRILQNPKDSVAWRRLLLMLPKIGAKSCHKIMTECAQTAQPVTHLRTFIPKYPALQDLVRTLEQLQEPHLRVTELLTIAWDHYSFLLPDLHDDPLRRRLDLQRLMALGVDYPDLDAFLADLTLDGTPTPLETAPDRIILSTIHSAKGLEWNAVIVVHTADGFIPAWRNFDNPIGLDEDLRLLYVAVTRAKEHLLLTYPTVIHDQAAGLQTCTPSRFVQDIDDTLLLRRTVE